LSFKRRKEERLREDEVLVKSEEEQALKGYLLSIISCCEARQSSPSPLEKAASDEILLL